MNTFQTKPGMKYLIYTRVSVKGTHETKEESSIPLQVDACKEIIKKHEGIVYEVVSDDFASGKELISRPGMYRIISDLENGTAEWDVLIAYSMTRFSRTMLDLLKLFKLLEDNDKHMICLHEHIDFSNPSGKFQLNIMCSVAQFWRECSQENVREKMKFMAKDGMYMPGVAPFGYIKKDKSLVPDPDKAPIVLDIFKKYSEGMSVDKLVGIYRNMKTNHIVGILRNSHYIGQIVWKEERFKGKHEAIVPVDLFNLVNARLPKSKKSPRLNAQKYHYLLSGLIHCHCGKSLSPSANYGRKNKYFYYKCTDYKNKKCNGNYSAPLIDNAVLETLKNASLKKAEIRYLLQLANENKKREMDAIKPELSKILDEKSKLETEIKGIEHMFINGTVDASNKEHFNRILSDYLLQRKKLEERRMTLEETMKRQVDEMDFDEIMKGIEKFSDVLRKTSRIELIQTFIRSRVERVDVSEGGKEISLKLRVVDKNNPEVRWWS